MTSQLKRRAGLFALAILLLSLAVPAVGDPTTAPDAAASADWPQWRGPNRDGVAPASPKLMDTWPANGPKIVWESAVLPGCPGEFGGGFGGVVVSGGKAFVYYMGQVPKNEKLKGIKFITAEVLKGWDWRPDIPEDLAKKVDEAMRGMDKVGTVRRDSDPKWIAYIDKFIATLDPKVVEEYGSWVKQRFKVHYYSYGSDLVRPQNWLTWGELKKLAALQDKEWASRREFNDAWYKLNELGWAHRDGGVDEAFDAAFSAASQRADILWCLDAATGKEVWKTAVPQSYELNGYHRLFGGGGTPVVVGDRCYVSGCFGTFCVSSKDGKLIWRADPKNTTWASPLVADGKVFSQAGPLAAYNAENGQLLWKQPKVNGDEAAPTLWFSSGKQYIIAGTMGGVFCVTPDKGDIVWQLPQHTHFAPVLVGDEMVIPIDTGKDGGRLYKFKLSPDKAEQVWVSPEMGWGGESGMMGTPVVYKDHIYSIFDHPRCFDFKTGEMKWEEKAYKLGPKNQYAMPIVVDGKVIESRAYCDKDCILMFKASSEKCERLGGFLVGLPLDGLEKNFPNSVAPQAVADGHLFVRMCDRVSCFDLRAAQN